jgi:hypothetical protein
MLAYCGINCDNCKAYKGTVSGDITLLEAAAKSFGGSAKEWVCLGCKGDPAFIAKSCGECGIRNCASEKGFSNCAACNDYDGCEKIHKFIGNGTPLATTMTMLRERFVNGSCCGRS